MGQKMSKEQYIVKHYKLAIEEMNKFGVPASITLAQGLLETNNGNSDLASLANNHFGIKCKKEWTGPTYTKDDDAPNECFRKYNAAEESYRDHSIFLKSSARYAKLFTYDIQDYRSWAYGLKEAGYATNPKYPQILIQNIEELRLYQYDSYGMEMMKQPVQLNQTTPTDSTPKTEINKSSSTKNSKTDDIPPFHNLKYVLVDKNFNLDDISKKYGLPKKDLLQINECENEQMIQKGQNFFLERKLRESTTTEIHEAKPGESIYDISQLYGIKVESLRKLNKIENWEQPQVGEVVFLKNIRNSYMKTRTFFEIQKEREAIEADKLAEKTVKATNTIFEPNEVKLQGEMKNIIHFVSPKETIFSLSKKYNCKPSEIVEWNNLGDDPLYVGQKLIFFPSN
jgi:LysM repeat protein